MTQTKRPNYVLWMLCVFMLLSAASYFFRPKEPEISYAEVVQLFEQEKVKSFTVQDTTLTLKLREAEMRAVRLHAVHHELLPVEAIVLRRVALKKAVAEYSLGRVLPLLVVKPVHTAEIGYPAFRAHARAAEKDDVITFGDHFFKFCDIPVHFHAPSAEVMFRRPLSRAR